MIKGSVKNSTMPAAKIQSVSDVLFQIRVRANQFRRAYLKICSGILNLIPTLKMVCVIELGKLQGVTG